jgi:hypothetical protein
MLDKFACVKGVDYALKSDKTAIITQLESLKNVYQA